MLGPLFTAVSILAQCGFFPLLRFKNRSAPEPPNIRRECNFWAERAHYLIPGPRGPFFTSNGAPDSEGSRTVGPANLSPPPEIIASPANLL